MTRSLFIRLGLAFVAVFLMAAMRGDAQTATSAIPDAPQPQRATEVHRSVDASFLLLEGTAAGAVAADVRTTCSAISRGYVESSPILPARNCAAIAGIKAGIAAGVGAVSYIAMRYGGHTGRVAAKVLLAFETTGSTAAAIHNARLRHH